MGELARAMRVAAVQMESQNGRIEANLERATGFVEQAAAKGAGLILLPEFMPSGYMMTEAIWDAAEPREGATVRWLKDRATRHKVWLGTSFLEADGSHFYNTFVLTSPDGTEAGRVRKQTPAVWEAFLTRGDAGSHVIQAAFGRVGVGICYENFLCYVPQMMVQQSIDLMLLPHADPTPMQNPLCPRQYLEAYRETLKDCAPRSARVLGVPAILANQCGPWRTQLPRPFPAQDSSFPGLSAIADADGTVKAQLGDGEGILVEVVTLDPSRKAHTPPPCYGRWAIRVGWQTKLFRAIAAYGRLSYSLSAERKKRAREISLS